MHWTVMLLAAGVMVVNGWTDAPNAIATAVSTGALTFRRGVCLAAGCNFLGALVVSLVRPAVAQTVWDLADFGSSPAQSLVALQAALAAVVLWATAAWRLGIPTSESHALAAGLAGSALALRGDLTLQAQGAWGLTLAGLLLSVLAGMAAGRWCTRRLTGRRLPPAALRRGQQAAAGIMAFLHGAQDGQKFLVLFLLAPALARGESPGETVTIPVSLALGGAALMALGTAMGGKRIIDNVAREMTTLSPAGGLAADLGAGGCLLGCTLLGLPVSTTHTKISAIFGAGAAGGKGQVRGQIMVEILLTWLLTFPCCGALAWVITRMSLW